MGKPVRKFTYVPSNQTIPSDNTRVYNANVDMAQRQAAMEADAKRRQEEQAQLAQRFPQLYSYLNREQYNGPTISADNRTASQRRRDQAAAQQKRQQIEKQQQYDKNNEAFGQLLGVTGKLISPSTYLGAVLTDNPFGSGFGDESTNFAADLLVGGVGAFGRGAVKTAAKATASGVQKGMRFINSPLTGNWTQFGKYQYRLNPNQLGSNMIGVQKRLLPWNERAKVDLQDVELMSSEGQIVGKPAGAFDNIEMTRESWVKNPDGPGHYPIIKTNSIGRTVDPMTDKSWKESLDINAQFIEDDGRQFGLPFLQKNQAALPIITMPRTTPTDLSFHISPLSTSGKVALGRAVQKITPGNSLGEFTVSKRIITPQSYMLQNGSLEGYSLPDRFVLGEDFNVAPYSSASYKLIMQSGQQPSFDGVRWLPTRIVSKPNPKNLYGDVFNDNNMTGALNGIIGKDTKIISGMAENTSSRRSLPFFNENWGGSFTEQDIQHMLRVDKDYEGVVQLLNDIGGQLTKDPSFNHFFLEGKNRIAYDYPYLFKVKQKHGGKLIHTFKYAKSNKN